MKIKINSNFFIIVVLLILFSNCTKNVIRTQCTDYQNYDSLRNELLINYSVHAYIYLESCHNDSNIFNYTTLLYDSNDLFTFYSYFDTYLCKNDTIYLYYLSKCCGEFKYISESFVCSRMHYKNDSIKNLITKELLRYFYGSVDVYHGNVEKSEIFSLINCVYNTCNDTVYNKLRKLLKHLDLFPIAVYVASNSNNAIACVDAVICYMYLLEYEEMFNRNNKEHNKYILNNLVQLIKKASDLHYAPASFILANMYFSGDLVPQDTIKGKKLLDEYGIVPIVPFWRYKPNPPIYQQLLIERDSIIQSKNNL